MTRKIFLATFLTGLAVLLLCAAVFFGLQVTQTQSEILDNLKIEAVYAESGAAAGGAEFLGSLDTGRRFTWISADGALLYDSEPGANPSDELSAKEMKEAAEKGEGSSAGREGGDSFVSYALKCRDGSLLRIRCGVDILRYAFVTVSPVLWMIVLVLLFSGVLAFRAAKQILEPVNSIDLDRPDPSKTYAELKPLLNRIDEQNLTIGEREDELVRRQKEFTVLTDSMSEGLVLLDKSGKVLVANRSALSLLPECAEGETFPLPESAPSNPAAAAAAPAVKDALRGARREVSHSADGETWRIIANPVSVRGKPSGAVLLLMDVTEREQRERLRREFSANVSHELKTPLTSISGFAELMMNGLATGDKVREFSADIWRESRRMLSLVDDIIRLSRLDEMLESQPRPGESPVPAKTGAGTEDGAAPEGEESDAPVWEDVDLGDLAADVLDSLKSSADKREIRLELKAEPDAKVRGVWPILYETVYNLCDNAVKYNRDGGSVTVEIGRGTDNAEEEGEGRDGVRLTVRDTGIGIPKAHRSRVFERFYRVDKSHSQEIGGTGLGLSIVKHGAQLHGAEIELESEVGVGTAVTLFFPPIQS